MDTGTPKNETVGVFLASCFAAWESIAPSYVKHETVPLAGHLRELHAAGATSLQFREALEVAFAQPGVTKRSALQYAYGIVRRQLREANSDGA